MRRGLPTAYHDMRNPLPTSLDVVAQGERLFTAHCATCHGQEGAGDGPAGEGLSPPPANLRWLMRRPIASDGYLYWTLTDGGVSLGTEMPAFESVLTETDRWKIIRFLRALR